MTKKPSTKFEAETNVSVDRRGGAGGEGHGKGKGHGRHGRGHGGHGRGHGGGGGSRGKGKDPGDSSKPRVPAIYYLPHRGARSAAIKNLQPASSDYVILTLIPLFCWYI